MKHLIILAAGGYGREIYNYALDSIGYATEFDVKGFLDDNPNALDKFDGYPPILGKINDYVPENDDVFICAVGTVSTKQKICESIIAKGGKFISLISHKANIGMNVKIGNGCIICPLSSLNCDIQIGNFVTIQPYAILGHDVKMGDWCHVNDYADCGGATCIGNNVTIHTHAFILPKVVVEDYSTIGAGSIVLKKVKNGSVVFGVPAKPLALPTKR